VPQILSPTPPTHAPGEAGVVRMLTVTAAEVRRLWQAAVDDEDYAEMARWIETGQAVHRALIAIDGDRRS
jgi:hypothetical protein